MYKDYDLMLINFIPAVGSLEYIMRTTDAYSKGKVTFLDTAKAILNTTLLVMNNLAYLYAINNGLKPFTE